MSVIAIVGIAIAIGLASFGTGWTVHDWKTEAAHAKELQAAESAREKAEALREAEQKRADWNADLVERKLGKLRVTNTTINNEVRREVEKTIYTNCVVPDTGADILRRAVTEANRAAGYDAVDIPGVVPAAPAATKPANDGRAAQPR